MNNKIWLIIGLVVVALICCCCVAVGAIVALDPFQLDLVERLTGQGDTAIKAMPTDTGIYIGFDVLGATPDKLNRVIKPFAQVAQDSEVKDWESLREQMNQEMFQDLNLTFENDLQPWLGQYLGIGFLGFLLDSAGNMETVHFVMAVEARDAGKADEFLGKLKTEMSTQDGNVITESEYQGVAIVTAAPDYGDPLVFGRSGGVVLFSTSEVDLMRAIDAQKDGNNLGQNALYKDLINKLPAGRLMTVFMDMQQFMDTYFSMLEGLGASSGGMTQEQLEGLRQYYETYSQGAQAMGMSATIVDAGLQFDLISSFNEQEISPEQKLIIEQSGPASTALDLLPEDTFFYEGTRIPAAFWTMLPKTLVESKIITQEELDEAMQQMDDQFGVNPLTDLLPYMNGDFAVAAFPDTAGLLADQANMDIGLALLAETNNPDAVRATLSNLSAGMEQMGMSMPAQQAGDLTYYVFADPSIGSDLASFGVKAPYLALATHSQTLQDLFAGQPSLAQNARFRQAASALPNGMDPFLYVDVQALLDVARQGMSGSSLSGFDESTQFLEPIPTILAGVTYHNAQDSRSTLIIFIKPAE